MAKTNPQRKVQLLVAHVVGDRFVLDRAADSIAWLQMEKRNTRFKLCFATPIFRDEWHYF